MKYFIGIDGGGSKTLFMLSDDAGNPLGTCQTPGTYYHQDGLKRVVERLLYGVSSVMAEKPGVEVSGICFGMPAYGEGGAADKKAAQAIAQAFVPIPVTFENDVTVAWAGSLALSPGINIVAGTGSMAYGRNAHGSSARSGGWSEFFSDEGSCYWLGRRALELFSKQSDGRLPRGRLYSLLREFLQLDEDMAINAMASRRFSNSREATAILQRVLAKAANEGDQCALGLYGEAAGELACMIAAVASALKFAKPPKISYSGGLFRTGELILAPLKEALNQRLASILIPPALSPVQGALLIAAQKFAPKSLPRLKRELLANGPYEYKEKL